MRLLIAVGLVVYGLLIWQGWLAYNTVTIAALGDSLFTGAGVGRRHSLPVKLEHGLRKKGYNVKMYNYGVGGDTTTDGLLRLEMVLAKNPDIVILELNGNDMLRGIPVRVIRSNLEAMITRIQEKGSRILLTGNSASNTFGDEYARNYEAIFPGLAEKYHLDLCPDILRGVEDKPRLVLPDGLHPTEEGLRIMAKQLQPYLEKMLNEMAQEKKKEKTSETAKAG